MALFNCKHCGKQFKNKHSTAQYCDKECFEKSRISTSKSRKISVLKRKFKRIGKDGTNYYQNVEKKGFYVSQKESYSSQIINYDQSPTGKAFIGINKEPLMPNKTGVGYQGVLLQDDSRQFIQCSSCGSWMKRITSNHVNFCFSVYF